MRYNTLKSVLVGLVWAALSVIAVYDGPTLSYHASYFGLEWIGRNEIIVRYSCFGILLLMSCLVLRERTLRGPALSTGFAVGVLIRSGIYSLGKDIVEITNYTFWSYWDALVSSIVSTVMFQYTVLATAWGVLLSSSWLWAKLTSGNFESIRPK